MKGVAGCQAPGSQVWLKHKMGKHQICVGGENQPGKYMITEESLWGQNSFCMQCCHYTITTPSTSVVTMYPYLHCRP